MQFTRHLILSVVCAIVSTVASAQCTTYDNTCLGTGALQGNTTGSMNAAVGYEAMQVNTTGTFDAAFGFLALEENTTGYMNAAFGADAMVQNTIGAWNSGFGMEALNQNTSGNYNLAGGGMALEQNTTGNNNTALGWGAIGRNTTGSNNIGVGYEAGVNSPATASNNIFIGNEGQNNDYNGVVRIGTAGNQQSVYIAGVFGVASSLGNAVDVMIDSNGQLVTRNSSIRFKEDVHDMATASDGIYRLRPVTYRYRQPYADGSKPVDYGLIAEEVAKVYPDLVVKNSDGQIQTVQYQKLTPMLLNELQKQRKLIEQQAQQIRELKSEQQVTIERLEKRLAALETRQSDAAGSTGIAAE